MSSPFQKSVVQPKTNPQTAVEVREKEKTQKRERLRTLLINKMKGKYLTPASTPEQENLIVREVTSLVNGNIVNDSSLHKLDQKLSAAFGRLSNKDQPSPRNSQSPRSQGSQRSNTHPSLANVLPL